MPYGPGKYDEEAMEVLKEAEGRGVLLMVFEGKRGSGFSWVGDINIILKVPEILRVIAKQIEDDMKAQ